MTWARVDLYREIARGLGLELPYRNSDVLRERDERLLTISRQERIRPVRYHSQCWSPFRHQTECCT